MIFKNLHTKYLFDSSSISNINISNKKVVSWKSPSNIALVKYWGKHGDQLPRNPSISFSLSNSVTETSIEYKTSSNNQFVVDFYFEGLPNTIFKNRIQLFLKKISPYVPFINNLKLKISSNNTFPHSSGIASSASSLSALALCICSIEQNHFNTLANPSDFFRKASFLSRLGSGSACRSVFEGVSVWGELPSLLNTSNEVAVPLNDSIHPIFKTYNDAILIVSSGSKNVSSTAGHQLMNLHPYANARYQQATENAMFLISALQNGDEQKFLQIVENEALSLHGLMLSSMPNVILLQPNTLNIIHKLKMFRADTKINFTFTLDAGPNIHLLYAESNKSTIINFINSDLKQYCENGLWIDDKVGVGPIENKML